MIKKMFCSVVFFTLISSCAKDSGTPDPDFLKDVQEKLGAYVWHPVLNEKEGEDKVNDYKPDECEMDNGYRFLFQEKSNQVDLNKGVKICEENKGAFEQFTFKDKNSSTFTFNKEKGIIKFANQDEFSSYLVVVNGDKLVLTSQNNNPTANFISIKCYFKGVKK